MKFHTAILTPAGTVHANCERDSDELERDETNRRLIADFEAMLQEKVSFKSGRPPQFHAEMGEGNRYRLEWQQCDPLSALGIFTVNGYVGVMCLFLHGFEPMHDAAVIEATEVLLTDKLKGTGWNPSPGLRSVRERPVMIATPWQEAMTHRDWSLLGNVAPCYAVAFFRRATAFIEGVDQFYRNMGFRKGGSETEHLLN